MRLLDLAPSWLPFLADQTGSGGLYDAIDKGGVLGLLCVLITVITVGGMRGWYFFGWYVKELRAQNEALRVENKALREDNNGWRQAAFGVVRTGERLVEVKYPQERG